MPRPRTGTLYQPSPDANYRVRITVARADGTKAREVWDLGTTNRALAERRRDEKVRERCRGVVAPLHLARPTVDELAEDYLKRREAAGIVMTVDERRAYEHHIKPAIGSKALADVTHHDIQAILDGAAEAGRSQETCRKLRSQCMRMFKVAMRRDVIATNPADAAMIEMPIDTAMKCERVILTDEEFAQFMAAPVDTETRFMALAARLFGGMRSGDVCSWRWEMIDRVHFQKALVPRMKTRRKRPPQELMIPEPLSVALRARWEAAGKPETGIIFGVEKGRRAGEQRAARASFAKRLRRELYRAGIVRHECTRPNDAPPPKYTGRVIGGHSKHVGEMCCPNMAHDPLYALGDMTLPVDFHSFRRAYATALADAGTNVQEAMVLTGHTDPKVHQRYQARAVKVLPAKAMPQLGAVSLTRPRAKRSRAGSATGIATSDGDDSDLARPTGFEPVTRGLEVGSDDAEMPHSEALCETGAPSVSHADPHSYDDAPAGNCHVPRAPEPAPDPPSPDARDVLLRALVVAAEAGDAATIATLAAELRALRLEGAGVVDLARRKRGDG